MFKRILLPVDGSKNSRNTWAYAKHLIEEQNAMVELLYVNDNVWVDTEKTLCQDKTCQKIDLFQACDDNVVEFGTKDKRKNPREAVICDIKTQAKEYFKDHHKNITMKIINGNPAHKIMVYSKEHDFDVIIMSTHGIGALRKFTLGSVTHKVVNHSEVPVLIVR